MPGKREPHGERRRLAVADLADDDNVRIVPQEARSADAKGIRGLTGRLGHRPQSVLDWILHAEDPLVP